MTKISILIIITLFCTLCGANQEGKCQGKKTARNFDKRDTSLIVLIHYDTTMNWIFRNCKSYNLTETDKRILNNILIKAAYEQNIEQRKLVNRIKGQHPKSEINEEFWIIDLNKYKRQYIAVINNKGEKEVWVHCFCGDYNSNKVSIMRDAGSCDLQLKINLSTNTYYDFETSGESP